MDNSRGNNIYLFKSVLSLLDIANECNTDWGCSPLFTAINWYSWVDKWIGNAFSKLLPGDLYLYILSKDS